MVGEKLELEGVDVFGQLVDLHAVVVVDVGMVFLGNSEEGLVVQEGGGVDGLAEVDLRLELEGEGVHHGDVPPGGAREDEVTAGAGV